MGISWCVCYLRTSKICLEIYELDPASFLAAPGIAWQTKEN